MKTFKSIEELKPYYNKMTNTYEFYENGQRMDVEFKLDLNVDSNINAWNINALNINAWDINAWDINALDIKALDINARDIKALDINARDIDYFAVCFAYNSIKCTSIEGRRENARHFVLDGKVEIKPKPKEKVTLNLTEGQLEKIKKILEE